MNGSYFEEDLTSTISYNQSQLSQQLQSKQNIKPQLLSLKTIFYKDKNVQQYTQNNLVLIGKQSKTCTKLENGLVLINLNKIDTNCSKRIYNLKSNNISKNVYHKPTRSKSTIVQTHNLQHGNTQNPMYQTKLSNNNNYINNNTHQVKTNPYHKNQVNSQQQQFGITFVKIGSDFEAIQNEFSLSQINNQKDVMKLFEISNSRENCNGYVNVKPLNQILWLFQKQSDYIPLKKDDIVNVAGCIFQIKNVSIPKIQKNASNDSINNQTINSFIDTSLLQDKLFSNYIQQRLKPLDKTPIKVQSNTSQQKRHINLLFKTSSKSSQKVTNKFQSIRQSIQSCRICFNNQTQIKFQIPQSFQTPTNQINNNNNNNNNNNDENLKIEIENYMMIQPCQCKGSVGNVHFTCMKKWIDTKIQDQINQNNKVLDMDIFKCDICKTKLKNIYDDVLSQTKVKLIDLQNHKGLQNKSIIHMQYLDYDKVQGCFITNSKEYAIIIDHEKEDKIKSQNFKELQTICSWELNFKINNGQIYTKISNSKYGLGSLLQKGTQIVKDSNNYLQPVFENVMFGFQESQQNININKLLGQNRYAFEQINETQYNDQVCSIISNQIPKQYPQTASKQKRANILQRLINPSNEISQQILAYQSVKNLTEKKNQQDITATPQQNQYQNLSFTNMIQHNSRHHASFNLSQNKSQNSTIQQMQILNNKPIIKSQMRLKSDLTQLSTTLNQDNTDLNISSITNHDKASPFNILRNVTAYQPKFNLFGAKGFPGTIHNNISQAFIHKTPNVKLRRNIQTSYMQQRKGDPSKNINQYNCKQNDQSIDNQLDYTNLSMINK